MKRNSLLFFLLLFFAQVALAQETTSSDVLYLKDGSVIRGEVTIIQAGNIVKIVTATDGLLEIGLDEVETIYFELDENTVPKSILKKNKTSREERALKVVENSRFYNSFGFGMYMVRVSYSNIFAPEFNYGYSFSYSFGYRFNRFAHLGLSLYLAVQPVDGYGSALLLEYRGNILDSSGTPFYKIKVGIGADDRSPFGGGGRFGSSYYAYYYGNARFGPMVNIGLGYQFATKSRLHPELSTEYLLNKYWAFIGNDDRYLHIFQLKVAVSF